jgi:UPF0716 protein FxsA
MPSGVSSHVILLHHFSFACDKGHIMKNIILLGLILLVGEVAVWIGVAQFISGWWIFLWTVMALFIGLNIIRSSLAGVMPQMQQMQQTMQVDATPQMTRAFGMALAGFLLVLPGLISDLIAAVVMIPAVQTRVQATLMKVFAQRQQAMMNEMMKNMQGGAGMGGMGGMGGMQGGQLPPEMMEELMRAMMSGQAGGFGAPQGQGRRGDIIEGEARQVQPDVKKITKED